MQKIEFDPSEIIEDGAPAGLPVDMMYMCGVTPAHVHASTRNLFSRYEGMRDSCFYQLHTKDFEKSAFERDVSLLKRGEEWLLEPLRSLQPKAYDAIVDGGVELWSGFRVCDEKFPIDRITAHSDSYISVGGRAYHIDPYGPGRSPFEKGGYSSALGASFPQIFLDAWLSRVAGWQLIRQVPRPVLPHAGPLWHPALWSSIDVRLDLYGKSLKKKYLPRLKSYFGEKDWRHPLGMYHFVCFLDTRVPDGFSKSGTSDPFAGDQFYIHMGRTDRVVYHIHHGDLETLRTIPDEDLAEAFDGYFAHVFRRARGEYDFMPYSRVLAKI